MKRVYVLRGAELVEVPPKPPAAVIPHGVYCDCPPCMEDRKRIASRIGYGKRRYRKQNWIKK